MGLHKLLVLPAAVLLLVTSVAAQVATARLEDRKLVQQNDVESQVALTVVEPEAPRPSKMRETVERVRDRIAGGSAKE